MKLAIAKDNEIKTFFNLCTEIEAFYDELKTHNFEDISIDDDAEYFSMLHPILKRSENIEEFMQEVFGQFNILNHTKIHWNITTLLENCADKSLPHLDFNTEIKKGFDAVELLKDIAQEINRSPNREVLDWNKLYKKITSFLDESEVGKQEE